MKVKNAKYEIGEHVSYSFCPTSKIVGVDNYTLKAFDGKVRRWTSYTLTSGRKGPFYRWWIVNVPQHGPHFLVAARKVPKNAVFDAALSGLVELKSQGNAALSSPRGALAVYRAPGGAFYAEEVFEGARRMMFAYKPFKP